MSTVEEYPVAIVGGGPVGLTTSLLLSRLGIRHVLFERHPGTSLAPRALLMNQRTIEVFRSLGLGAEVEAIAAPPDTAQRSVWYTSLAGPTPLHGRRIAVRDSGGGGRYQAEHAAASPARMSMVPQFRLEPVLLRHATASPVADVQFSSTVTAVEAHPDRVVCEVVDEAGEKRQIAACYLVGADGGRSVAEQLGITMLGPTNMVDMVSAHFSADLAPYVPDRGAVMNWFVNPDFGGSRGSGQLYAVGPWSIEGWSEQWVFACAFKPDEVGRFDDELMRSRLIRSLGVPELDFTLHSVSHWQIQATVADRYSSGRVFLVGDAAHKVPPLGGLGLNTGIQDAENLAWKLALAIDEPALSGLLGTYDSERRPVAQRVAATALASLGNHASSIDAALGLSPTLPPDDGWRAVAEVWADSDVGRAKRDAVAQALRLLDTQFHPHGVEVGYSYTVGALSPQAPGETDTSDVVIYTPSSTSGHHIPHAWLQTPEGTVSTIDLARPGRLALVVDAEPDRWEAAVRATDHPLAVRIDVVEVGDGHRIDSAGSRWSELREVTDSGALLVRPDKIVAWRCHDLPVDPGGALTRALREITGPVAQPAGTEAGTADPASAGWRDSSMR